MYFQIPMNTLGAAMMFTALKIAPRGKEKDVYQRLNVKDVHLEDAYSLQKKRILKAFRTPRRQGEIPYATCVQLTNLAHCKRKIVG